MPYINQYQVIDMVYFDGADLRLHIAAKQPSLSMNTETRNIVSPMKKLNTGFEMPAIAFGTWDVRGARGQRVVESALEVGYRAIDTAFMYENHDIIGKAIRSSEITRSELFVTTKLNAPFQTQSQAFDGVKRALEELQLEYLDLILVHEPYRQSVDLYRALERAQEEGLARSIGVSNFDEVHLARVLDECEIIPAVDQCESHVYYPQLSLAKHLQEKEICMQAWAPFTEGKRPLFSEATLANIACTHGATIAQVALAYLLNQGVSVCVKSSSPSRQAENLASANLSLTQEEISRIATLDEGSSLFGWYDESWL